MKSFYVKNPGLRGVEVNVGVGDGRRRVLFNGEGVSEALSEEEYRRLIAMKAFNHYAIVEDGAEVLPTGAAEAMDALAEDAIQQHATGQTVSLRDLAERMGVDLADATEALPTEGEAPPEWAEPNSLAAVLGRVGAELIAELMSPDGGVDLDTIPPDPSLVERFKKGDQEARVRFVEDGKHTHAELLDLFNIEANWRRSRKVLDALDKALVRAAAGKSVETINRALVVNSAPAYQGE